MTSRERQVLQRLVACPSDHRRDTDWSTNHRKNLCQQGACRRAMCEWCAAKVKETASANVLHLWCEDHAHDEA